MVVGIQLDTFMVELIRRRHFSKLRYFIQRLGYVHENLKNTQVTEENSDEYLLTWCFNLAICIPMTKMVFDIIIMNPKLCESSINDEIWMRSSWFD